MNSKLKQAKIGQFCNVTSSKRIFEKEYQDFGVPFYRSKEIIELSNNNRITERLYISEKRYNEIVEKFGTIKEGDLLLTSVGTIGVPYIVKESDAFYFKDGNLTWLKDFSKQINSKYLYYYIKSNFGLKSLKNLAIGSSQPALTIDIIKKYCILLPDIIVQNKIVDILQKYDDLIEKNNRKIAVLEEQIQELYREWFVRFRFPGYEKAEFVGGVPKDWKFEKFGERYNITIGKTPPREETNWFTKNEEFSIDWSSIADIRKGMFLQRTSEQLTNEAIDRFHIVKLPKRTILLSFKLTVGLVAITTQEFTATNEAIAHFICRQSELEYLYMFLKNYDYNRLGNTSSIGNAINSKIIRKMNLVVPTKKVLELFHNKTKCMFDEIEKVQIINSKIEIIRDSLLPRLMSGKLEVKG